MATDWEWWRVKAALAAKGLTLVSVALGAGLKRGSAHTVKTKHFPTMQAAVAKAIGVPADFIWPSRYDSAGRPIPARPKPKPDQSDALEAA